MAKQGIKTAYLGRNIRSFLDETKRTDLTLFYDHGDRQGCPNPNDIAAIKGFCGDEIKHLTRIVDVDIILADSSDNIAALVEVEERPLSPKKLLGIVLAVMICDGFAVKCGRRQRRYKITPQTVLLIAGSVPTEGGRLRKIKEVIQPRIRKLAGFKDCLRPGFKDWLDPKNIELN